MSEHRVKIIKTGIRQAVEISEDFALLGKDTIMRKEGERLVIEPAAPSLLSLLATLKPLDDDFPQIDELPLESTIP